MNKRRVVEFGCFLAASVLSVGSLCAQSVPSAGWQVQQGDEWKPVDQTDLRVAAKSALDFSWLVEAGPAGKHGYVVIDAKGDMVFADRPDQPVRMLCCSDGMATFPYKTPEEIDAYADEVVRAGYNIFRPHFLDTMLMRESKQDLEFSPKWLDVWDRLSAALKKRGIYLYLDATTSWLMFSHIGPWDAGNEKVPQRVVTMYWDESAREHWKAGVTKLLTHVNPYTGVALKDEPQVAILQMRNETGLGFKTFFFRNKDNEPNRVVTANFRKWLTKKYGTNEALRKAWLSKGAKPEVANDLTLDTVKLPELYATGPDTLDLYLFFTQAERELFAFEREVVRGLGVKSLMLDYNNMHNIYSHLVRDMMDVTDSHGYHGHPTNFNMPGSSIQLKSVAETCAVDFIPMASARQWGRPIVNSEWGLPFWHPWRGAEAGLVVPAYAALQGWQMLTQHGTPVLLTARRGVYPFTVAIDPPAKAAERMAALMYLRGDVKRSPHVIQANVNAETIKQGKLSPAFSLPEPLTRLGLLAGFGTRVSGMPDSAPRAAYKADIEFTPTMGGKLRTTTGVQSVEIEDSADKLAMVEQEVESLRRVGVLSASNRTNPAKGIYESDTGEILMDSKRKQMEIRTERSQGCSLSAGAPEAALPNLQAKTSGETMGVFLGALDDKTLSESRRMLLIIATDALNSDMKFTDPSRATLADIGKLPVLVKTAKVDITIANQNAENLELWALDIQGRHVAAIPLNTPGQGRVSATIDTAKIGNSPPIYYELRVKSTGR